MQKSGQITTVLRFKILKIGKKFRHSVDLDATPTFEKLRPTILKRLKEELHYSHLNNSHFKICDSEGFQIQPSQSVSTFASLKTKLKIELNPKILKTLMDNDQNSATSYDPSQIYFPPKTESNHPKSQHSLSILSDFGQEVQENIEIFTIRIVNSPEPLSKISLPIKASLQSITLSQLSNLLKKKVKLQSDANILTFYDESGIPYTTSIGIMSYQNCKGVCVGGRQLLAVITSIDNDLLSHPKKPIDSQCIDIIKIKIQQGALQTKKSSQMIPVNLEKHSLLDLKCFISNSFNIPTYRIHEIDIESSKTLEHEESSIGNLSDNDNLLLKDLNISSNIVLKVKMKYSSHQEPKFVWYKNALRKIQPIKKQTQNGMIEFYSCIYMLSSNKFVENNKIALCGLIRQLTKNNAALVHAFYKHIVAESHLFQSELVALIQGFYHLFLYLLYQNKDIAKYIEVNSDKVFQYSRGIFSALCKHIEKAQIPEKWIMREKFEEESFTCPYNENKSIRDLVGLRFPIVDGDNKFEQLILCQRESAEVKITSEIQADRKPPQIQQVSHLLIFHQLYHRLDRCSFFIRWQNSYNPKNEGVCQLTSQFALPYQSKELVDQFGFYIQQLKTQTAVTFQGYVQHPTLFEMNGGLLVYLGKMPCSNNEIEAFDLKNSRYIHISLNRLQKEQYQLDKAEQVKDQIMITREPEQAIVVIFDASGSMNLAYQTIVQSSGDEQYTSRLTATQQFFKAFADRTMAYNFKHVISLIIFSDKVDVRCNFTECFLSFKLHINKIEADLATRLYDAIMKACDMLNDLSKKEYPKVVKRILCLSDGEDNDSQSKVMEAYQKLLTSQVILDSFIVGDVSNDLKCLTFASGGSCFYPKNVHEGVMIFESETVLKASIRASTNSGIPLKTAEKGAKLVQDKGQDNKKNEQDWLEVVKDYGDRDFSTKPHAMKRPKQLQQKPIYPKKMLNIASQNAPNPASKSNLMKMKRIFKQMYNLNRDPHPDAKFYPSEQEPTFWNILIRGPEQTPYQGYVFHLYASFGQDYPHQPPQVRFLTPIYHCNINIDGRICHSIFDRNYSITVSMRDIINHIFALLMTPEPKDPLDNARASEYFTNREVYDKKARKQAKEHAFQNMGQAEVWLLGGALAKKFQQESKKSEPPEFLCAMSDKLMNDPVMLTKNKKVYERNVIEAYIIKCGKVPEGDQDATIQDLVAMDFLKKMIAEYVQQKNWYLKD